MSSMEKQSKLKNKILKVLPKAVSAFRFQNPPFSPNRAHHHAEKRFSGPIVSMIPDEARRKKKGESLHDQEPTSPKVSCMGKIKNKKKVNKEDKLIISPRTQDDKKKSSGILKILSGAKKSEESIASHSGCKKSSEKLPALGQMKRFSSGRRDALGNFDCSAQIAPVDSDFRSYDSDEDRAKFESDDDDSDEDFRIPFSAPIARCGDQITAKPKKEVNLWKRRTMDPPRHLQLNPMFCED